MRVKGLTKIIVVVLLDMIVMLSVVGAEATVIAMMAILLYGWLGEYTAMLRDRVISFEKMSDIDRSRLESVMRGITNDVSRISKNNISNVKIGVVPANNLNAYAYGLNNISVTTGLLNACDDAMLEAVIGHEIGHVLSMDAFFNRLMLGTMTAVLLWIAMMGFAFMSFLWIVFIVLCFMGIGGGFFSVLFMRGASKGIDSITQTTQKALVALYQIVNGALSRKAEFNADMYSAQLGYGDSLRLFLERYILGNERQPMTLSEVLYDSHPSTYERIQRLETRLPDVK